MAMVRWQVVCICCGKGGSTTTRSESAGAPSSTPPSIGGTCPSSPDKKHKPRWERA